jgi:hypothetical protein
MYVFIGYILQLHKRTPHLSGIKLPALIVIGTDCIHVGSCKSRPRNFLKTENSSNIFNLLFFNLIFFIVIKANNTACCKYQVIQQI